MSDLRVLVFLREAPAAEARLHPNPQGDWIDEREVAWDLCEADAAALECALRLGEAGEADVLACMIAPRHAGSLLRRTALALGVPRVLHVIDDEAARRSPTERAWILAQLARERNAHLVLTGAYSDDWGFGLTPVLAARLLKWSVALSVSKLVVSAGQRLEVVCELEQGEWREEKHRLPCVVSVHPAEWVPRRPTLRGMLAAKEKNVEVRPLEGAADPSYGMANVRVVTLEPLERRRECHWVHDVHEAADLVRRMMDFPPKGDSREPDRMRGAPGKDRPSFGEKP